MQGDKRDGERLPILGELQGEIMVFQPMLIREISLGGATVESTTPLHLDSLHDIRIALGTQSIVVKGRVVHSRISDVDQDIVTYRSGLQFTDMSLRVRTAIGEFLEAVRLKRSSAQEGAAGK